MPNPSPTAREIVERELGITASDRETLRANELARRQRVIDTQEARAQARVAAHNARDEARRQHSEALHQARLRHRQAFAKARASAPLTDEEGRWR